MFLALFITTILIACEKPEEIYCADTLIYEKVEDELPPESFVGTVLSEDTSHMIVRPNKDEEEYAISDTIRVEYVHKHVDYLYGIGRKVVITHIPPVATGNTITTDDIRHDGFEDFKLSVQYLDDVLPVYTSSPSPSYVTLVANNRDFDENASDYNLYYLGLYDVYVNVDGETLPLKEALYYGKVTLDGIIAECNRLSSLGIVKEENYKDGGSSIYDFGDFKILKYHTLDGNRDIFIGTNDLNINSVNSLGLCIRGQDWKDWGLRLTTTDVSNKSATIVFSQNGGTVTGELQTGEAFYIEKMHGNKWIPVDTKPCIDYAFYMTAFSIFKGGSFEHKTDWEWLYGELPAGKYRIIKEVMDFRKTADFDKQFYYAYFEIKE